MPISYVNFIVGWRVFTFEMYVSSSSLVPVHMMNISSMYLFQVCICSSCSFSSSLPMNRFAYEGAILVPMAVPCFWR